MNEKCRCGHDDDDHERCGDPSDTSCTVCTCNEFDWDITATGPSGSKEKQ